MNIIPSDSDRLRFSLGFCFLGMLDREAVDVEPLANLIDRVPGPRHDPVGVPRGESPHHELDHGSVEKLRVGGVGPEKKDDREKRDGLHLDHGVRLPGHGEADQLDGEKRHEEPLADHDEPAFLLDDVLGEQKGGDRNEKGRRELGEGAGPEVVGLDEVVRPDPVEACQLEHAGGHEKPSEKGGVSELHFQNSIRHEAGDGRGEHVVHETGPKRFAIDERVQNEEHRQAVVNLRDAEVPHRVRQAPRVVFLPLGHEEGEEGGCHQRQEPPGPSHHQEGVDVGIDRKQAEAIEAVIEELPEGGALSRPPGLLAVHAIQGVVGDAAVSRQKEDPVRRGFVEVGRVVPDHAEADPGVNRAQEGHHVRRQPHRQELRQTGPDGVQQVVQGRVGSRLVLVVGDRLDALIRQRLRVPIGCRRFEYEGEDRCVVDLLGFVVVVFVFVLVLVVVIGIIGIGIGSSAVGAVVGVAAHVDGFSDECGCGCGCGCDRIQERKYLMIGVVTFE
mmetsp:Transcript_23495/g.55651  ORF Transcript_23495/g.55651 Transcript_23495/m.55651 type:complete len:501 (+) Transcript_23495:58-1560(+)